MIRGIGIDSVDIDRFTEWHTHTHIQLTKILSSQEIAYCLENPSKSAERFAVRFAAREAFFKALSYALPDIKLPFLTLCKAITIEKLNNGAPHININWQALGVAKNDQFLSHISVTHTRTTATAVVILT